MIACSLNYSKRVRVAVSSPQIAYCYVRRCSHTLTTGKRFCFEPSPRARCQPSPSSLLPGDGWAVVLRQRRRKLVQLEPGQVA